MSGSEYLGAARYPDPNKGSANSAETRCNALVLQGHKLAETHFIRILHSRTAPRPEKQNPGQTSPGFIAFNTLAGFGCALPPGLARRRFLNLARLADSGSTLALRRNTQQRRSRFFLHNRRRCCCALWLHSSRRTFHTYRCDRRRHSNGLRSLNFHSNRRLRNLNPNGSRLRNLIRNVPGLTCQFRVTGAGRCGRRCRLCSERWIDLPGGVIRRCGRFGRILSSGMKQLVRAALDRLSRFSRNLLGEVDQFLALGSDRLDLLAGECRPRGQRV